MKILITGVAGFIGYSLVKSINNKKINIDGVDSLSGFYSKELKLLRLKDLSNRINFFELDLSNPIKNTFKNKEYDLIIHLGAHAGVRNSSRCPQLYVDSNIKGHLNILELAKDKKADLIYASSSSVYGNKANFQSDEDSITDQPLSIYGTTKKTCEMLSQNYFDNYGINQVGLRFFTVYGRFGRPDMAYWLFTKASREYKPIEIYGDGSKKRDFTHITDIVEAIKKIIDKKFTSHNIYNVGRNDPKDINFLANFISSKFNNAANIIYLDEVNEDVDCTIASVKKLNEYINFKPRISFEDGMEDFIDWFKKDYESIKTFK